MATGKEIKRRIKSIKNTAKITKAMELISTVKMKKAQDLALEKKRYILGLMEVLKNLSDSFEGDNFFKTKSEGKTLGVIITSNKGLCGGYNVNVMKKVNNYSKETGEKIDFIALGKRGAQFVVKTGNKLISDFSEEFTDNINETFARSVSKDLRKKFLNDGYSKVVIFYNHYINTIKQVAVAREFLPLNKDGIEKYFETVLGEEYVKAEEKKDVQPHTVEPSKEELLKKALPMLVNAMFYDVLIEAKASEHSARMIAMKNAKDNANKYAGKLKLQYNKARQAAVTKEVSEIVSGVESMK